MATSIRLSMRSSGFASFDRETLAAAKAQIKFGWDARQPPELQSSIDLFFRLLAWSSAQARRAKIRDVGYGVPSDFELSFGRYLPAFGGRTTITNGQAAQSIAALCF